MKITFDADGRKIEVPYDLSLLDRYNECLNKFNNASWFPIGREKRITNVFIEFAEPYFPKNFDWQNSHPLTGAFFFQFVRRELQSSINAWQKSIQDTDKSTSDSEESLTSQPPSAR